MDWSYILDLVFKATGSLVAGLVITFCSVLFADLKKKLTDSKVIQYVKEAVKAAEQLYPNKGTKKGSEKYKYVVERVLAKFPKLKDNDYIKSLIEGAVFTLTEELGENAHKVEQEGSIKISI